jgi:hypothetical protein
MIVDAGSMKRFRVFVVTAAIAVLSACVAGHDEPGSEDSFERKRALAPIDAADVVVRESAPPQYALRIVSGLPSGCAEYDEAEVTRTEDRIDVTVWNTVPADENVACTMIYRTATNTIDLGDEFEPGATYTIRINGQETLEFAAGGR